MTGKSLFALCSLLFLFFHGCSSSVNAFPKTHKWSDGVFKDGLAARVLFSEVFDAHLQVIQVRVPGESGPVEGTAQVKANFLDREFSLYPLRSKDEAGVYEALVGVPYDQEPGELHIDISVVSGQRSWKVTVPFTVKSNKYKKETLKVDPTLANNIPKSVMPRIKRENILIGRVYKRKTQRKFWRTAFDLPVKSDVTSPFGTRRMFNKVKKGFHKGLDLRASVGTPIRAPASGVVVMSKDLYFTALWPMTVTSSSKPQICSRQLDLLLPLGP